MNENEYTLTDFQWFTAHIRRQSVNAAFPNLGERTRHLIDFDGVVHHGRPIRRFDLRYLRRVFDRHDRTNWYGHQPFDYFVDQFGFVVGRVVQYPTQPRRDDFVACKPVQYHNPQYPESHSLKSSSNNSYCERHSFILS